jgi:hypothetical protein
MRVLGLTLSIIRSATWLLLLIWVAFWLFYWAVQSPKGALDQISTASQLCVVLLMGFVSACGFTMILREIENAVKGFVK